MGSEIEHRAAQVPMGVALPHELEAARRLAEQSRSPRTLREYQGDWNRFASWAAARHADAVQAGPELIGAYIAHLVELGRRPSTINRAMAAISVTLAAAGREDHPTGHAAVRAVAAGARRQLGTAQRKARPLTPTELGRMSAALGDTLSDLRDRALLLLGFAAALRRREIVALYIEDVQAHPAGLEVTVRRSKTDQTGDGHLIPVRAAADPACCPARAWAAWRTAAGLEEGPAFRNIDRHGNLGDRLSDRAVSLILDRAARRAGLDLDGLSAHSLRAGYVTTAAQRGHNERTIANVSRHRSIPVLRGYVRRGTVWQDAATNLGW